MTDTTDTSVTDSQVGGRTGFHVGSRLWLFGLMILLALVGMGLTMSLEPDAWEYWLGLLIFYGGVSIYWAWQRARRRGEPAIRMLRAQLFHWASVLLVYLVLTVFERSEIINRDSASTVALLILALACLLAGVHFEWGFLLVGLVLLVMVVALGFLEQYVVWLVMLPVIIAAGVGLVLLRNRHRTVAD